MTPIRLSIEKDNKGRTGLCSLTLFPDSLFREAYTVAAMGPLLNAASVYVAVIVRTQEKDEVVVETVDSGVKRGTDHCEGVSGKEGEVKADCRFKVVRGTRGDERERKIE